MIHSRTSFIWSTWTVPHLPSVGGLEKRVVKVKAGERANSVEKIGSAWATRNTVKSHSIVHQAYLVSSICMSHPPPSSITRNRLPFESGSIIYSYSSMHTIRTSQISFHLCYPITCPSSNVGRGCPRHRCLPTRHRSNHRHGENRSWACRNGVCRPDGGRGR